MSHAGGMGPCLSTTGWLTHGGRDGETDAVPSAGRKPATTARNSGRCVGQEPDIRNRAGRLPIDINNICPRRQDEWLLRTCPCCTLRRQVRAKMGEACTCTGGPARGRHEAGLVAGKGRTPSRPRAASRRADAVHGAPGVAPGPDVAGPGARHKPNAPAGARTRMRLHPDGRAARGGRRSDGRVGDIRNARRRATGCEACNGSNIRRWTTNGQALHCAADCHGNGCAGGTAPSEQWGGPTHVPPSAPPGNANPARLVHGRSFMASSRTRRRMSSTLLQ